MSFTGGHLATGIIVTVLAVINFILIMVFVIGGHQSDLQTREFPAIKYENRVVDLTENTTVKASDSGTVFNLDITSGGVSVTLPTPEKGLVYHFQVENNGGSGLFIDTAVEDTQTFHGAITVADGDESPGGTSTFIAATGKDRIELNGTTQGGREGTNIEILGISGVSWLVSGIAVGSGTLDTPFEDQ